MSDIKMFDPIKITPEITSLVSYMPVPGFGVLPVNAYLIYGQQPMLVDTGLSALRRDFVCQLQEHMDLENLRWIWITHTDADHLGNLESVLACAPNARVITTYLGMGKMGMQGLPVDTCYLLNPGQQLDLGDRIISAVAPPCFDAPETVGLFDHQTRTFFSADCFGALLPHPVENSDQIDPQALRDGCLTWATVDAPWLHVSDPSRFEESLRGISNLEAQWILSAHLPPARGMSGKLLQILAQAPHAPRFCGPDQAMLEKMMAA